MIILWTLSHKEFEVIMELFLWRHWVELFLGSLLDVMSTVATVMALRIIGVIVEDNLLLQQGTDAWMRVILGLEDVFRV